jgi:hypothetical protein
LLFADDNKQDKSDEQQEMNGGRVSLAPGESKIDHLMLEGGSGEVIKGISLVPIRLKKDKYQCPLCKCNSKWRQCIANHIESHIGHFLCSFCNKSFKHKASLKQHLRLYH